MNQPRPSSLAVIRRVFQQSQPRIQQPNSQTCHRHEFRSRVAAPVQATEARYPRVRLPTPVRSNPERQSDPICSRCHRCHSMKIRCSGGSPCQACINSGRGDKCEYPFRERKITVSEGYVDSPELLQLSCADLDCFLLPVSYLKQLQADAESWRQQRSAQSSKSQRATTTNQESWAQSQADETNDRSAQDADDYEPPDDADPDNPAHKAEEATLALALFNAEYRTQSPSESNYQRATLRRRSCVCSFWRYTPAMHRQHRVQHAATGVRGPWPRSFPPHHEALEPPSGGSNRSKVADINSGQVHWQRPASPVEKKLSWRSWRACTRTMRCPIRSSFASSMHLSLWAKSIQTVRRKGSWSRFPEKTISSRR